MNENRIYYVCCYIKGREDVEIGIVGDWIIGFMTLFPIFS